MRRISIYSYYIDIELPNNYAHFTYLEIEQSELGMQARVRVRVKHGYLMTLYRIYEHTSVYMQHWHIL